MLIGIPYFQLRQFVIQLHKLASMGIDSRRLQSCLLSMMEDVSPEMVAELNNKQPGWEVEVCDKIVSEYAKSLMN